jgi:predicted 3-demethylubiquinone-9 3-methyltransferase (glyoxalase superfamily)
MQKITPCLWFDSNGEEAMNFYTSIFSNAKIKSTSRWGKNGPLPEGTLLTAIFEIDGLSIMILNAGPTFKLTEAISLSVDCQTQEEIDRYWETLSEGGEKSRCGWLKDKFGLSWQIVPSMMSTLMNGKDPAKSKKAMEAMMKMDKLDIKTLQDAYDSG